MSTVTLPMRGPRSANDVLTDLLMLIPSGWVWSRDDDTLLALVLLAFATIVADFEAAAFSMRSEIRPITAVQLLTDYERVLGADPFGRDVGGLTLEQRQVLADQRWTTRGGASLSFFQSLAEALGATVTITPSVVARSGGAVCGACQAGPESEQFVWLVSGTVPAATIPVIEAMFNAYSHEETIPVFQLEAS